ncbi:ganglioside GM2 activator-like [Dreissena polymorpha]|uniref:MD-2-related lipid-recognition domain-containing protein n=1 Tax=Dreissena polymorpha TaxID=45954 RepID=A0A9D4HDU4_DREPO|nr:ganglioside GM2 activator-like [Dreissena polymorpha]XP_052283196.1 ganglioside GM2 activator-like [Dreissena polymorpha]KAH3829786.1 hypothetical protein DPMN_103015 [Dreissena polymorpha]KAH3829877.1 hypothetical protein DPMN_103108 [Dreissena polymorpha]
MTAVHLFTALFALFVSGEAAFSWKSCAPAGSPIHVESIQVGPDPVEVPGDMVLSLSGTSSAPIGSSSLTISAKRKTFLLEIPIPCINHIGSCTYDDICGLPDKMIAEDWLGVAAGLGQQIKAMLNSSGVDACPIPAQTLTVSNAHIHIPSLPSALAVFAAGDYHINLNLVDNASHQTTLCIDIMVTIHEPCSGLSCLFG